MVNHKKVQGGIIAYLYVPEVQHNTTQHNTTQHNTTQHNTTQHNTTQHNTTQHNTYSIISKIKNPITICSRTESE
jgi:hypothetical protein